MEVSLKDGTLTIKIKVNDPPVVSKSGKTLVVASSRGNKPTAATINNQPVIVGLNAYIHKS